MRKHIKNTTFLFTPAKDNKKHKQSPSTLPGFSQYRCTSLYRGQ